MDGPTELLKRLVCVILETMKPSSSAFDVSPELPVGCSLAVAVQTRSDPKNGNGGPSTCPVFL